METGPSSVKPDGRRGHEICASLLMLLVVGLLAYAALSPLVPRAEAEEDAAAGESATCEQYGCPNATCDQYGCAQEEPGMEPLPEPPASAPAVALAVAPASEDDGPGSDPAIEEEVPGQPSERVSSPDPSSESASASALASASAGASAPTEAQYDDPANSREPAAEPAKATHGDEEGTGAPASEGARPIEGYPHEGEPCEDRHCGLEGISDKVECVIYETASGKTVYGCADPKTYDREGCYAITFYTQESEPYAKLDTCSGEESYAPPEPPEGDFYYWKPPAKPDWHEKGFIYPCFKPKVPGPHCGIEGLPKKTHSCETFYDTRFGTVRGCYNGWERFDAMWWKEACGPVRAYDESGRYLGTFRDCTIEKDLCGENNCGTGLDRSKGWDCRRVTKHWGPLYGPPEREGWIMCLNFDRHDEFVANPSRETMEATCTKVIYPNGDVDNNACGHQGGPDIFMSAWKPAEDADDALNNQDAEGADPTPNAGEDTQDDGPGTQGTSSYGPTGETNQRTEEPPEVDGQAGMVPKDTGAAPSSGPDGTGPGSRTPFARAVEGTREAAVSLVLSAREALGDAAQYARRAPEAARIGEADDGSSEERPAAGAAGADGSRKNAGIAPAPTTAGRTTPEREAQEREAQEREAQEREAQEREAEASSSPPAGDDQEDDRGGTEDPGLADLVLDSGERVPVVGSVPVVGGWAGLVPVVGLGGAGALYAVRRRFRG
ncbi:MAG: hypothetical protein AVDCRST_MAG03-2247 [uncultured Rubrobacteraceae bacterium]|uniref:Uncharacterized protein n=1 Tax=uncultured Rubrobacteraceae bacterium TaxID=349277 RepID=A0A6J4PKG9_9ACTN|nr:MAG: hypothetical protein AVDCRST_MAG03-2247 [uncultured Rubrobacteraceae bacterium]